MEPNRDDDQSTPVGNPFQPPFYNTYPMKRRFNQISAWFNSLPSVGKVMVVIVGGTLGRQTRTRVASYGGAAKPTTGRIVPLGPGGQ